MQEFPITSETGVAIVAAYLVMKELISALRRKDRAITVHPDTDLREAIQELSKLLAVQTEILRNISENQKEIFRIVHGATPLRSNGPML